MLIHIGTSGYGYKEWKGKFYPEKISPKEMLPFYAGRLGSVEINNTFYRMPKKELLMAWAGQVPADFVFTLKSPQVITHIKQLRNVGDDIDRFFDVLSVLGRRLGAVLFQIPRSFHADAAALREFLELLPPDVPCSFEFRSPSWHNSGILDLIGKKGCSLCIADSDENPAGEIIATASWGYLRLRSSVYNDDDLSKWMQRILAQKWEKAFVFFKHEDEAKGPEMAMRFRRLLD